jgi:hypothetical protein
MKITLRFTLRVGTYSNDITDFATLEECWQRIAGLLERDDDSMTFVEPSGARTVIAGRHVVAVKITPAGEA